MSEWLVAGRGPAMLVGPAEALAQRPDLRGSVRLVAAVAELGPVVAEHAVAESGVRSFVVPWHRQTDGGIVAAHPVGGNQVSWRPEVPTTLTVTAAADPQVTAVHVRFLLRHLTTALLQADVGGRSVHAVTATYGDGVLAVAGPTRSGKTRLVNHLLVQGVVGDVVDDDCPVLAPGGDLLTLVPRRHEVARVDRRQVRALVVLGEAPAQTFLAATPRPWPVPWLPGPDAGDLPSLPAGLDTIEVPPQDESAYAEVARRFSRSPG